MLLAVVPYKDRATPCLQDRIYDLPCVDHARIFTTSISSQDTPEPLDACDSSFP
jgi:hypothetical protein